MSKLKLLFLVDPGWRCCRVSGGVRALGRRPLVDDMLNFFLARGAGPGQAARPAFVSPHSLAYYITPPLQGRERPFSRSPVLDSSSVPRHSGVTVSWPLAGPRAGPPRPRSCQSHGRIDRRVEGPVDAGWAPPHGPPAPEYFSEAALLFRSPAFCWPPGCCLADGMGWACRDGL